MRIGRWSAIVLLGALSLSGCAHRHVPATPATSPGAATSVEKQDYGKAAVEARTEAHARYTAAILDELNDNPDSAAENFYRAASADPTDETLVVEAAGRLLRQKQTERAVEILKKCSARPEASAEIHARLGLAYSVAGNKELAIEANRAAIKKDAANFDGYQYLSQLYLQGGQKDEGLKVLDEAAMQSRVDAEFLIQLGEAYLSFARGGSQQTARPKALEAFERAAGLKPANPMLLQRLGDGFNQAGDPGQAIAFYTQLLDKVPHLTFIRDRLIDLHMRRQERDKAAEQLKIVVKESPANPQAQYLLGSIYFEEKKYAEAEDCFSKTILLNSSFEPAYHDLAAVRLGADKPQLAIEILEKARTRFERSFIAEFYTAMAYSRLKDYDSALKYLTSAEVIARATATNRLTQTFYFQLGAAHERNKNYQEAEKYFRQALALSPDFAEALNYLGYMWAERGENLAEARNLIEKAVKLEPKNAAFLDSLGWVMFKLNQPKEALKWIQQSIEHMDEPDATLYDHLGDVYEKLNEPAKAREAWRKSMEIEANPQVEKKLKGPAGATAGQGTPDGDPAR